ncbi:putative Cysteine-rich venom protein LIO1 [Hypsibius exemplaris]|uniref:Cysteine-rich venom protein LIO1 n=1 Tax=Hypsibius exemplaris TaxID=2072580 RepID=A0A1W0XDG5_HYPEX|nr:putative Cysteine-rich venom protein LIO1 [Hypsibius exemplaris]
MLMHIREPDGELWAWSYTHPDLLSCLGAEANDELGKAVGSILVSLLTGVRTQDFCLPPLSPYNFSNPLTYPLAFATASEDSMPNFTTLDTSVASVADYVTRKHNCLRSIVSPTASNMLKMNWNTALKATAQTWANNCVYDHNNNAQRIIPGYIQCGQNIAAGTGLMTWNYVNNLWYGEVANYAYGVGAIPSTAVVGHYTQQVWAVTDQLGCAWKSCPAAPGNPFGNAPFQFYVCNYCTAGNFFGQNPYVSGASCSACPAGTTCLGGKLCGVAPTVTPATVAPTTVAPTTPTTVTPTVSAPTTPIVVFRPPGYDRCDALFCNPTYRGNGNYYVSPCSKNYCNCNNGVATWLSCPAGQYRKKSTNTCETSSPTFCPVKNPVVTPTPSAWPGLDQIITSLYCSVANCNGRGTKSTWFTMGLCSPYWCYCNNQVNPVNPANQTCGAGQYFDFRSEVAACVNKDTLPWCPESGNY